MEFTGTTNITWVGVNPSSRFIGKYKITFAALCDILKQLMFADITHNP